MAGSYAGWNGVAFTILYQAAGATASGLVQMTRPECEAEYETNAYPFKATFLGEYISRMSSMNENVCCYDLQAVSLYLRN